MLFVLVTAFAIAWSALAVAAHLRRATRGSADRATSSAKASLLAAAVLTTASYALALPPLTTLLVVADMRLYWPAVIVVGGSVVIFVHMFYLFSVEERDVAVRIARRDWLIYAVVMLATILLFAMSPTARDFDLGPEGRYRSGGPGDPFASLAYILPLTFGACMSIVVCRLGRRWVKMSKGTRWLAMGLNTNAAGQIMAVLMDIHLVGYNIALLCGVVPPWTQDAVESPIKGVAGLLTMLGLSATALSSWMRNSRIVVWAHANQARRRLYPLWRTMCDLFPAIAVEPPPASAWRDMLRIRGAKRQVLDRIVELWEGRQHLRVPAGTRALAEQLGEADGLRGPALDAAVEAACLKVGFEVARLGLDIRAEVATADKASRLVRKKGTAAELRWWEEVHAARSSRTVADVFARTRELARNSITSGTTTAS